VSDATAETLPKSGGKGAPPGIWTFIAADCAGFAIFFLVFMSERMKKPELFDDSARLLDIRLGLANTLILISSSWLVALAISAAEQSQARKAKWLIVGGLAVGSAFFVLKIAEYYHKVVAGITPATNDFFAFYYILTGVHFLHYAIGLVVLVAMILALHRKRNDADDGVAWLEAGGLYWHMVDLLWLFLFPMLYLLPSH
jgi:nitric oxide reductase NorE protein